MLVKMVSVVALGSAAPTPRATQVFNGVAVGQHGIQNVVGDVIIWISLEKDDFGKSRRHGHGHFDVE